MPSWGNTDVAQAKPHFPEERQVRINATLTTANLTTTGANNIVFVGANSAVNAGITTGMFIYGGGPGVITSTGQRDFFKGNVTVTAVSGNVVTISAGVTANVAAGTDLTFDTAISFNSLVHANTFADTILVTPTRMANSTLGAANTGNFNAGWVRMIKKTNNDGTVRYLRETLVALANPVAANTNSANTSFGQPFTGV